MLTTPTLIMLWITGFLNSPSKTCLIPISRRVPIPDEVSDNDRKTLLENNIKQLHQRVREVKDTIYAILLVTMGGLATLSFLLLGDLITLGPPDHALQISLCAFAVVLPLLAASYWNLRLWNAIPEAPPSVDVHHHQDADNKASETAVLSVKLPYMQLLTIIPAALMAFVGIISVLWHVFWIASIVFLAAVLLGVSFISFSSVQHLRASSFFN